MSAATTDAEEGRAVPDGRVPLWDRVVPAPVRANPEALVRARVVIGMALSGLLGDLCFGSYSAMKGDVPTLILCGIGSLVQLSTFGLLWKTKRVDPPAVAITVLWIASIIASSCALEAGFVLRSGWPLLTIMMVTYLLGARAGVATTVVLAVSVGVVAHLQALGVVVVRSMAVWATGPSVMFAAVFLMFLCALVGSLHQRAYLRVVGEVAAANAHIQRREAAVRTLLDSSTDVLYSIDRQLRIVEMNEAARANVTQRMGRTPGPGERLIEDALGYLSSAFQQRLREGIAKSLDGEHVELEDTVRAGGQSLIITITIDPVRLPDQTVVGATLFGRDITERRQREARSMIHDRMTTVGTLAAGMAHELNNPLGYVVSNLEYCSRILDPDLPADPADLAETRLALADAREGADRMRVIIRDLKTFSRGDDTTQGPVELKPAIEAALKMCLNELRHRAQVVRDFDEVPAAVGNPTRIEQVVLNLLVNAIHAIPEGEAQRHTIKVRTRPHGASQVMIEITDTGEGIAPENLKRIFDPFFTTKPVGVGTGLGLSICHNLVKGMGGEIEVTSQLGQGTTFRVLLPAQAAPVKGTPLLRPRTAAEIRATVLLVDDEGSLGVALRRALGAHGVELTSETRGSEALERLRRGERFDLMLCDLMMPDMTGMDLFALLQHQAPDQVQRLAFLSGGAFSPRARTFIESVQQPSLSKPCSVRQLLDLIQQVHLTGTTLTLAT